MKYFKALLRKTKIFYKNLLFIFNKDLSHEFINVDNIHYYLDNLKFELPSEYNKLIKPKIISPLETIEKIIQDKVSISRFGDGEFELLFNRSIPFQKDDRELSKRLQEILISNYDNILIGIPYIFWYEVGNCNLRVKNFIRREISRVRKEYENALLLDKTYYATEFTQLYMTYSDDVDMSSYFDHIRRVWDQRDITIIQGEGILDKLQFDVFDNAASVLRVLAPSSNAFSEYQGIFDKAKLTDKNRLVLIILGPTATVLAFDLAKLGYQALDIGHTAKDYDYYMKNLPKSERNLSDFFLPD